MKKNSVFIITAVFLCSFSCNKPELIIFNRGKLGKMKTVSIREIEARTVHQDPYLVKNIADFTRLELARAGYKVIEKKEAGSDGPEAPLPDALVHVILIHQKYYKGADETESISVHMDFYDGTLPDERTGTVQFSQTCDDSLLNSKYLKTVIRRMINDLHAAQ